MALGGGYFAVQNKVLPGSYINFVSVARAESMLSERGYATMPLELDWGMEEQVFTVTREDMIKNSKKIFGYDYKSNKLKGLRDFFQNALVGYFYRLNTGVKASNDYAEAKYGGVRGNDITIVIQTNVENPQKFDVITKLDNVRIDMQTGVAAAAELQENDYVSFKTSATLAATAGTPLTGGTNGAAVTGEAYQNYLDKIESYSFHTMGCLTTDESVKALFTAFQKRMREEVGVKFQTVLYQYPEADYEGVISVENKVKEESETESSAIYWVTGAEAGVSVNTAIGNRTYNGEFDMKADYTQTELERGLKAGKFMFHQVGEEIKVLSDVNTFVSYTEEKNSDFGMNQVIRVLDQIATDIAVLFNKRYLGRAQNNDSGRASLWSDIITHHKQLEQMNAIENFSSEDVIVEQGDLKKSVVVIDKITVTAAMEQLYMTVAVA